MRAIYLLNFVALALARPEGGYNYRPPVPPSNQYGAPGFTGVGTTGIGTGFIGGNIGGNIGGITGGNIGGITGGNIGGTTGGFGRPQVSGTTGGQFDISGTGNFGITGTGTTGGISTITTGGVGNVHRHVYVYTAPQEEELIQQKQITTAQAQKHYKIIFIKAPSFPAYSTAAIQAQAQNQEKTIIYVLAKRPDEIGDISLPTVAPTQPSKPEVYFIKYKTQKTAATTGVVDGGVNVGISTGSKTGFTTTGTGTDFTGTSTSGLSTQYGPPGQSGPY